MNDNSNNFEGMAPGEAAWLSGHPSSLFGEAPERLKREIRERHAARLLCTTTALLHDYFRFGDPAATEGLELFLHENATGLHAESLLDELEAAIASLAPATLEGTAR